MGLLVIYTDIDIMYPEKHFDTPQPQTAFVRLFYLYQLGAYTYGTFSTMFIEPPQKDFWEMLIHHGATLLLVALSYIGNHYRTGISILVLTDISDPFMELAKVFLYSGATAAADVLFATFAVVFLVSRNIIYPIYVLPAATRYGAIVPYGYRMVFCLYVLQMLFIFWGYLIIKMAVGMYINGDEKNDSRDVAQEKQKVN
eukprot:TRINITY_DN2278_c0_g1_i1.p1 TRINITY_DN2278_c0_g1~~TRINITY_DN2278_c0_g1_i1.p1  ORF type:complete len:199 (+),score=39.20 TRINITY_DN2278_c0_g1_i1:224-820(+)